MDVNHERFGEYETAFNALAEDATPWEGDKPALDSMALYLCLYGDNGLAVDDEFTLLETLKTRSAEQTEALWRIDIEADYYQDIILFVK